MDGRLWMLVVLVMVAVFPAATTALRCVNCKGCSKFEDSQAVTCPSSADRCLKLHLPSGLINRECGDEKTCVDKSNDRDRFLAVHCCETNICNGGSRWTSSGSCLALLPLLATSFRSFSRY
ncbi:hypothetical protein GHT06_008631 [Daphnia sinensis]|uniref:UPAR/Ly6 domain-containing protein n=1 Tax=Daphnia sinensis TaxID=1820382 RepID=A0AAD5LMR8_9CRUS|nr:hypothetical protein GHT06_008631 [Daphnia sinensis]